MADHDSDAPAPAPTQEPTHDATRPFSITQGPLLRLLRRFHLTHADGSARAWPIVAITWGPLMASALGYAAVGLPPAPFLRDLSVHARLLIVVPLLLQAERILDRRCRSAIHQLYAGRFADRAVLDRILDRAERLRDSQRIVLAFAGLALLGGLALQWGFGGLIGLFTRSAVAEGWSLTHLWYSFVAWPVTQLLVLRWLWHWVIWSYITVRLSRLPLATIATHPDHAAGIGFLAEPVHGFAGFVLALSALIASAWETQLLDRRATLHTFVPEFAALLVVVGALACGPLLLFVGMLYRARRRDIVSYNQLALDYVRAFHRKWVEARAEHDELLGTADLQSLHDLCGAYGELEQTRLVPFGPRTLIGLLVATVVPMLPLVLTAMPFEDLLQRLLHVLLGTLPGVD